ncbi:MAG: efflux RND transporter periplasmic adaptor subunit [Chloroherpetonaceae bacterium]
MTTIHCFKKNTLASLAICFAVLSGCGTSDKETTDSDPSHNPQSAPVTLVKTAKVERVRLSEPIYASGILFGKEESRLSFKLSGIIDKIFVKEGESVKQGKLLATLKLSEINAQVSQAKNAMEKAERDLKRVKSLYDDKVATLEQLQDATTGYDVAKSALTIAQFNQQYASIYAPTSGKVLKKFAEENELIGAGSPVLQLSNAAQGFVLKVGIADKDAVRLRVGDSAKVSIDAFPSRSFSAVVTQIAGASSMQTGTFEVELKLAPSGVVMMSGLIGKAELYASERESVWLVPIEAVVEGDGTRGFVFTSSPDGAHAKKVAIQIAFIQPNGLVAVRSGLDVAQCVITDGASYLSDGSRIQTVAGDMRVSKVQQ